MISGVSGGVGKSLFSLGLAMELRKRSIGVSCVVTGLNLSQAGLQKRISGRYVHCLDEKLLSRSQLLARMFFAGVGADLVLIEGQYGLFDGGARAAYLSGIDSEIAALTKTPVVLVFDARGFGSSVVALLKGFGDFAQGFNILGAIANRMPNDPELFQDKRQNFNDALAIAGMPPLLGVLPEMAGDERMPSGIISQRRNTGLLARQFLVDLGQIISQNVDIDRLVSIAQSAQEIKIDEFEHKPASRRARIAVSDDSAFNICFQDNLDLLRFYGAELVPFSPLADATLPARIGGIYITGGFLGEYGQELSANQSIKRSIRDFADSGGLVYSEGAGTVYLGKEYETPDKQIFEGVGILSCSAVPGQEQLEYCESVTIEESIFGRQGLIVKNVSTNDWRIIRDDNCMKVLRIARPGASAILEGYSPGAQVLSTLSFCHFGSNPVLAKNLVDAASVVSKLG